MSKVTDVRRTNIRKLIEQPGALSRLAKAMGYKNPSFLSQMTGPEPSREVSEKTARRVEAALGLAPGVLDRPMADAPAPARAAAPASTVSTSTVALVADVIRVVGQACEDEGLSPAPTKFADLVALAYADTMERGTPRPEHVKMLVRLLR